MNSNEDCFRFRKLHYQLTPGSVWGNALLYPSSLETMAFLAKLWCLPKSTQIISYETCESTYTDELVHKVFACNDNRLSVTWLDYWNRLAIQFPIDVLRYIQNSNEDAQLLFLLGHFDQTLLNILTSDQISELMNYNAAFLRAVFFC